MKQAPGGSTPLSCVHLIQVANRRRKAATSTPQPHLGAGRRAGEAGSTLSRSPPHWPRAVAARSYLETFVGPSCVGRIEATPPGGLVWLCCRLGRRRCPSAAMGPRVSGCRCAGRAVQQGPAARLAYHGSRPTQGSAAQPVREGVQRGVGPWTRRRERMPCFGGGTRRELGQRGDSRAWNAAGI